MLNTEFADSGWPVKFSTASKLALQQKLSYTPVLLDLVAKQENSILMLPEKERVSFKLDVFCSLLQSRCGIAVTISVC